MKQNEKAQKLRKYLRNYTSCQSRKESLTKCLERETDDWVAATSKDGHTYGVARSQKLRSKTFPGIARAMAEQWAGKITE